MIRLFIYALGCVSASSIDEKGNVSSINEANITDTGHKDADNNNSIDDTQNADDVDSIDEYVEEVSLTDLTQGLEKNPDCWGDLHI